MVQCEGFVKDTKTERIRQCGRFQTSRFCHDHVSQCRGLNLDGEHCRAKQKPGYKYCRANHDPDHEPTYVNPSGLRLENLRGRRENAIVRRYKNSDPYNSCQLPTGLRNYHLDHKFELQCGAFAVRRAELDDPDIVVEFLCDHVLNENFNLCLTDAATNKIKGAAVTRFLDDTLTGHRGGKSFTTYLREEKLEGGRLSREVTKRIRKEMDKASKECLNKLEDESEDADIRKCRGNCRGSVSTWSCLLRVGSKALRVRQRSSHVACSSS